MVYRVLGRSGFCDFPVGFGTVGSGLWIVFSFDNKPYKPYRSVEGVSFSFVYNEPNHEHVRIPILGDLL